MAGGADGETVRRPYLDPTTSRSLVIRRLAQAAAGDVVRADVSLPRSERRLVGKTVEDPAAVAPDEAAFELEVAGLAAAIFAGELDDTEREALRELYRAVREAEGGEAAWASVVTVLLRDPQFWTY